MWNAIILAISLHLVHVIGSRSSDLLPTCNWVRDEGNGLYPGWYAIDIKTPMNYCNSYNAFNASTLDVTESGSWYYACNATTNTVDKVYFMNSVDCGSSWTDENHYQYTSSIDASDEFKCDAAESCLMHWTSYVNKDAGVSSCNPDKSKIARDVYGVNGGCQSFMGMYTLWSCNDWMVMGSDATSNGISLEFYEDPFCDNKAESSTIQIMKTGECSAFGAPGLMDRNMYMGDVSTCDGVVDQSDKEKEQKSDNGILVVVIVVAIVVVIGAAVFLWICKRKKSYTRYGASLL